MATILLSAAGAAVGAGFGGAVLGLSGAVIGRAVGATLGRVIDQRLLGTGARAVETGRLDRFRLTGASEGAPIGLVWGRMRIAGQVIWASRFQENVARSGGGKGAPRPAVRSYSYSVSLAIALCEGEIARVGRIWADGTEIARGSLDLRVYPGSEDQLPDPLIEAVEGAGQAPSYRGVAYVVIENLELGRFGNRVPQFSFEVVRPAQGSGIDDAPDLSRAIRGVALIPGTGEYALATTPVHRVLGPGRNQAVNVNSPAGTSDLAVSLDALAEELPACRSALLVVSWFGDDLRCDRCGVRPRVENRADVIRGMEWRAGGIGRAEAGEVIRIDGRPAYGGTPADRSVIEAIAALRARGIGAVFYPFVLMEQLAGNGLADPWGGGAEQPALPWRGRITLPVAPGRDGTGDRTAAADAAVAAFFGTAARTDFSAGANGISYHGPDEWSYRRFILHYAHLCAAAGGVDAFCIGSELRGLTQIRGQGDAFPAVQALRALAADVRAILGPGVKIGYAADWSEYWGYQDGEGNRYFHLDPLWADGNIDFVGIDNYMPLSDWRDGTAHADVGAGSIYDVAYLQANIEGGEGFDWYYASADHRASQRRTPITDGAFGEPWVWRYKDIRSWWSYAHHERIGGVRQAAPTAWVPGSKPVWFTEFGCPAIDKGTNEPNRFVDPKSSESAVPHFSDGRRDDLIQMQYLRAVADYWSDPAKNPQSAVYGGPMIDMGRAHVWAWDARPFPQFPGNAALWADGDNYRRGHWVSGRATAQPLSGVVAEICARSGVGEVDVSGLYGLVRGYQVGEVTTARAALQPLMLAYGFEAAERGGVIRFSMRGGAAETEIDPAGLAVTEDFAGAVEQSRAGEAEVAGRVRLAYVEAEGDYEARAVEAIFPDETATGVAQTEVPLALVRSEGQRTVERWLAEARVARDTIRLALPPSRGATGPGDVVRLGHGAGAGRYRIDRIEEAGAIAAEAVRIERPVYLASDEAEERVVTRPFLAPAPVLPVFLDLPLMTGEEVAHAPHLAVAAEPWPGPVAVLASDQDAGYAQVASVEAPSVIGVTETALEAASPDFWDRGPPLRVRIGGGLLASAGAERVLNGANLAAIGDGSPGGWELFQFAEARLVGPGTYELSRRLRGQFGTDAAMPAAWPAGSTVVLLGGGAVQVPVALAQRGLLRHFRIGPAARPLDDPAFEHLVLAFEGIGLRPYRPVRLRARRLGDGTLALDWIRRTRIGGDSWAGLEVPLGEASERYLVRVVAAGGTLREESVGGPAWSYPPAAQVADGVSAPFELHVAQVSETFGPGPFARITVND